MLRFKHLLLLSAGLALGLPAVHAQLQTFETLSSYNGEGIIGFTSDASGNANTLTQTFNNVLEIQSITFRFTPTASSTTTQNFEAYLVQWNPGTNKVSTTFTAPTVANNAGSDATVAQTTTPVQTFSIPPLGTGSWATDTFSSGTQYQGYDVTLNLNQLTDPDLTYAIVLVDTSVQGVAGGSSGLGLLDVALPGDGDAFAYGNALSKTSVTTPVVSYMETHASFTGPSGDNGNGDWGFSQIVVVPQGNLVPVPEPRTAAAIIAALFVAFLVGRRLWLNSREETLVGAMAA